jgi:uncharacterized membrane-anchored protein
VSSARPEEVQRPFRRYLSKTPEISVFFWVIKVLASAAGEPVADLLGTTAGLGLGTTTMLVATATTVVLLIQFSAARHVPWLYWCATVLISVMAGLVVDNLTETLEVPLDVTVIAAGALLVGTFAVWFAVEKTLSIHTVDTARREAFYWLAVLLTFVLGAAAERLAAPSVGAVYSLVALLVAGLGSRIRRMPALIPFWSAYLLTQPLGVAASRLLSEPRADGGLQIGVAGTNAAILAGLAALVRYESVSHRDDPSLDSAKPPW